MVIPRKELPPLAGAWFQVLFTPLLAVLFTFPSQYWFAIGLSVIFSLARWCWQLQTGFLRSRLTQDTRPLHRTYAYGTITCCGHVFQTCSAWWMKLFASPTTPQSMLHGLGYFRFRSPLLAESLICFLFLRLLRCFSSPGYSPLRDSESSTRRVSPFGHLRIKGRLHLPAAFRSLPRPSSSLRAKASPMRPSLLPILNAVAKTKSIS